MVRKSAQSRHSMRPGSRRPVLRRRGPVPLADDSWDDTLAIRRPQLEPPRRRTGRYRWAIVAVGLASIVVLVGLIVGATPGLVGSGPDSPRDSSTEDGVQPDGPGMAALHSMPASPSLSPSLSPSPSDTPSGRGGDRPTGAAPPFSADSSSGSSVSSTIPPPPPTVAVEAETGVRGGSASLTTDGSASGGAYVGGIGNWGEADGPGTLTLTSVKLPSTGTWRLTIYFLDDGPKGPRHATVIVSGADPHDLLFAGPPTCCGTRTLDLSLSAGSHTVTFSSPDDAGPSLDLITFTLLPPV
jgi:hypothetical protein